MEKLDQLELILEVFFRRWSAQSVLRDCSSFYGIREEDYVKLAFPHATAKGAHRFSQEDLRNQFRFFRQRMEQESQQRGHAPCREGFLDPMDCLFYYAGKMLHIVDNEVVCHYWRLLNWRSLTRSISEDLPVAAFLADNRSPDEIEANDLNWKLVVGHDNHQLRRIMERGLAENHFHLYGSAPVFHLSWLSLMNRLTSSKAAARLRKYDRERNNPEMQVNTTLSDSSLHLQHLQAASIRLILFIVIHQEDYPAFGCSVLQDLMRKEEEEKQREALLRFARGTEGESEEEKYQKWEQTCREERRKLWSKKGQQAYISANLDKLVKQFCVPDGEEEDCLLVLEDRLNDIQSTINALRDWHAPALPDYALLGCPLHWNQDNGVFLGERWLLYQCLHRIRHGLFSRLYTNLFYAYLILKERIRRELIHSDDGVGFTHFQDYDRRKFDLLEDSILHGKEGATARAAMRSTLLNPNIRSLEIRLSPSKESARDNADFIENLDTILGEDRNRYFYTFHFLKQEDSWHKTDPSAFYYRHYAFRRRVCSQAGTIRGLRERYPLRAERVLGIDAAAKEIGCRPEVFGTSFRFLHQHHAELEESSGKRILPQLRRTYHVGEDFLDVVDGLRAIDEAIRFLGLESGDRLGHALALGVDVKEWYTAKNYVITLPLQDYLDNVVWLYHQLLSLKQLDTTVLQEYLKREFSILFAELYQKNMSANTVSCILRRYQEDKSIPLKYRWNQYDSETISVQGDGRYSQIHFLNQFDFDIYQYYQAWKLRGDDPALYDGGFFKAPNEDSKYDECQVNRSCPDDFGVRYVPGVFLIHYYYHYSQDVRREGERAIQRPVKPVYIDAVAQIQRAMQKKVADLGLGIECNPTSNVTIGTFRRYDNHPILRFYNRELEVDSRLLEESPQLLVSINTDDQGVFSTSLENEYALMACALEKVERPDGSKRYPRQLVYSWLNAIRKMGLEQSFGWRMLERDGMSRRFRIKAWRRWK